MPGKFTKAVYERDDGTFGPVRVQTVSLAAWNPQAVGVLSGYYIHARGSKRAYGVVARSVSLSREIGSGAAYNAGTVGVTVPVFQKAIWQALTTGQTLAYAGIADWVVAGTNSEESK